MAAEKIAEYKGRKYRLLFIGQTKFGRRAKLGFIGASNEFWVDAAAIRETSSVSCSRPSSRRIRTCPSCGGNEINQVDCGDCA